jgi:hypothetical protein
LPEQNHSELTEAEDLVNTQLQKYRKYNGKTWRGERAIGEGGAYLSVKFA